MILGSPVIFDENTVFRSASKDNLTFQQVYEEILKFVQADTDSSYRISVGTDSQVGSYSVFVSCILVHRVGKGAIGFFHRSEMQRAVKNLREKIYLETSASLQLAYMFDEAKIQHICRLVGSNGKYKGVTFEFHIDIGTKGQTKSLINEMVGMVKGLDFIPRIKPDSYCASSFADKYTKAM